LPALEKPRLAVVRFSKWSRAEPEQQRVLDDAIAILREAGAVLEELELPELDQTNWDTIQVILSSEAALIFGGLVERFPDRTSDHLKSLVRAGKTNTATDYLAAKALQKTLLAECAGRISGFDAVLTLPAFGEAPAGLAYTGDAEYCAPWTLLGVPAISLPSGFGKHGLPLGLQIVGAYRQDYSVLRVAKWVESVLKFDPGNPGIS
jgi:Asp-tRNA(Asn)/Glu-tRNA(Gln) amidotransferase A subunit family amidase